MTFSYDPTLPNPPNDPGDDVTQMQVNSASISQIISVDHVGFNAVSGGGFHNKVTFNANNVPVPPVSPPVLFTDTVAGLPQLKYYSGDAAHSSDQYYLNQNAGNAFAQGSTFLFGGIILKWGFYEMANGVGTVNITFFKPFPNAAYSITFGSNVSGNPNNLPISQVVTLTTTGFTAARVNGSSGGIFRYYFQVIGN